MTPTKPSTKQQETGWSDEEKAAMKEYAAEKKRQRSGKTDGEQEVRQAIATMSAAERKMAEAIHRIVKAAAPSLSPKTWYGMPAYANGDGQPVCFFQCASKFKARYNTLGFTDKATLDEGKMWPSSFALTEIGKAEEAKIAAIVKKAVSG